MSDPQEIRIKKLFGYNETHSKTRSDIYIGKPASRVRDSQKLIVLADLPSSRTYASDVIDSIIEHAVDSFNAANHATPELVLESVLESMNALLPTLLNKRGYEWIDELNLLIAVAEHGQVHFSQIGEMSALYIHENSVTDVAEMHDRLNPLKIFENVTSGLLSPGDTMILTNYSLTDYIADDKLKELCEMYPPDIVIKELESVLSEVPRFVTFASVFIKFLTDVDMLASSRYIEREPNIESTSLTEEIAYDDVEEAHESRRTVRSGRGAHTFIKNSFYSLGFYAITLWRLAKKTISILIQFIRTAFIPSDRKANEDRYVRSVLEKIATSRSRINEIPKISKIFIILIILIVFTLIHVLIIQGQKRQIVESIDMFNEGLVAVSVKRQEVNNAIIYNDEKMAEQILLTIDSLLRNLQPTNREQEDQIERYLDENSRELNKIRHINYITDPLVFADFSSIPELETHAIGMLHDTMILSADNSLYKTEDGNTVKIGQTDGAISKITTTDNLTIAVTDDNRFYSITDTGLAELNFSRNDKDQDPSSVKGYGPNLYILDQGASTIFKHTGSRTSFSSGTEWLNDDQLLAHAYDMAIDGNVYVLTEQGSILKFLRGDRQDFSYTKLNPPLGSNTRIYTSSDSDYIYLLDPANNRIIILTKEGTIKDQYTSPKFSALKDLTINSAEDTIAVLSGKTIYLLAIKK